MNAAVDGAWRSDRAALVARLARRFGDLDIAEDAAQDAFAIASATWPQRGIPDRPGAWLWTVASRRAIDTLRRSAAKELLAADDLLRLLPDVHIDTPSVLADGPPVDDDLLGLILACSHPALAPEGRIALTLRHVAGFRTREIAAALLVAEAAMEKRLVRARAKLRAARVSLEVPAPERLHERLDDARTVIWLIFTEGYLASADGSPVRRSLCDEAIWLARALRALAPHDRENTGLLAALLFHHARVDARLDASGDLVAFERQDRTRWNQPMIEEARTLLAGAARSVPGPYCVTAAIAALHACSHTGEVAWQHIASLYEILQRLTPSDIVDMNYAYAVGRAEHPRAGLLKLAAVNAGGRLERYAPLHAARADLCERDGNAEAADAAWRQAAECSPAGPRRAAYLDRIGAATAIK